MLNNYFTIKETAENLNKELSGKIIEDCYTQEKNKLLFEISGDSGTERHSFMLEFSIEKDYNYIITKNQYSKAKRNFASLFEEIVGSKICEVKLHNNDRAICFVLDNNVNIIFIMYSSKANSFLTENETVINAFKNKEEYAGKNITDILPAPKYPSIDIPANSKVSDILKLRYKRFGNLYTSEMLHRLNITKDQLTDDITIGNIENEFKKIDKKLETPGYYIYRNDDLVHLSLIETEHLNNFEKTEFKNINELIIEFLKVKFITEKTDDLKDRNIAVVEKKIADIVKKLTGIEIQLSHCEDSESLKRTGDMILQNIYLIKKGDTEFKYTDEKSAEISIKLKKDLSPADNAGYYFDKYKKQKNSIDTLKAKLKSLQSDKAAAEAELQRVKNMTEYKSLIKEEKKTEDAKNDETSRFRKFVLNEKFEVWVGKDSVSNDTLTTKYAAQNDLWFHVRGSSGSHTVLKVNNKKEDVGKEFIMKAAAIAAYYSKARNASNVPVAYCEKKYVKKKKGFKQGSVIMEREKVVFVKPALPDPVN